MHEDIDRALGNLGLGLTHRNLLEIPSERLYQEVRKEKRDDFQEWQFQVVKKLRRMLQNRV